jgi:hypothetical protein
MTCFNLCFSLRMKMGAYDKNFCTTVSIISSALMEISKILCSNMMSCEKKPQKGQLTFTFLKVALTLTSTGSKY